MTQDEAMKRAEAIKQVNAIMALEGFKPDSLSMAIDAAVIAGRITNGQAADEMVLYAKEHKSLDGFHESRDWLKENDEQRAARLAYEEQALRAYEKMQATGLHSTPDELKQWAQTLAHPNTPKTTKLP